MVVTAMAERDCSGPALVAINWRLRQYFVSAVIIGAKRVDQLNRLFGRPRLCWMLRIWRSAKRSAAGRLNTQAGCSTRRLGSRGRYGVQRISPTLNERTGVQHRFAPMAQAAVDPR